MLEEDGKKDQGKLFLKQFDRKVIMQEEGDRHEHPRTVPED